MKYGAESLLERWLIDRAETGLCAEDPGGRDGKPQHPLPLGFRRRTSRFSRGCSELRLLQFVDVVAELQGRPQLESQVLHDHVALQEQQGVPINLLQDAGRDVWSCNGGLSPGVGPSANLRVF